MTHADKRLAELAAMPGASARSVAKALRAEGHNVSASTVGRRMRRLLGARRTGRRPEKAATAPAVTTDPTTPAAESPSDDDDLERIDRLLAEADAAGNLPAVASLSRVRVAILEHRRKAAPVERPAGVFVSAEDMDAAATRVRERWHQLADALVRVSNSPVADTIARLLADESEGKSR